MQELPNWIIVTLAVGAGLLGPALVYISILRMQMVRNKAAYRTDLLRVLRDFDEAASDAKWLDGELAKYKLKHGQAKRMLEVNRAEKQFAHKALSQATNDMFCADEYINANFSSCGERTLSVIESCPELFHYLQARDKGTDWNDLLAQASEGAAEYMRSAAGKSCS